MRLLIVFFALLPNIILNLARKFCFKKERFFFIFGFDLSKKSSPSVRFSSFFFSSSSASIILFQTSHIFNEIKLTPIIPSTFRKGAVGSIIRDTIADNKTIVPRAEITAPCARALPLSRKGLRRSRTLKRRPDLYIRNIIPLYWFS